MLLQPIFLGGATITIAVMQARQSFVLPALGQVIYTVCLILGILAEPGAIRQPTSSEAIWASPGQRGVSWLGALLQFRHPGSGADTRKDAVKIL